MEEKTGRWPMPRCGKPLRYLGEPCARRVGHKDYCRSEYAVENMNAARRAGLYVGGYRVPPERVRA